MDPKDLIQRSPLRALDQALAGGLGRGDLGLVVARHGAGKTPFLVGVALDHLLRGERVLHVALDHKVDHVREYYDQIFEELARESKLEDIPRAHLEMERGRRIHTYLGTSFSLDKLSNAMSFMREHASFEAGLMVLDGYDFSKAVAGEVEAIRDIARQSSAALWMSVVRHRDEPVTDADRIPAPAASVKELASVILELRTLDGKVGIDLLKPRIAETLPFVLDPTTMLLQRR